MKKDFYDLMEYCGMPRKVRDRIRNNPNDINYIQKYDLVTQVDKKALRINSMFIHGSQGTGKTTMACQILCQLIRTKEVSNWGEEFQSQYFDPSTDLYKPNYNPFYPMQFIRLNALFRKIKQTFDKGWDGATEYDTLQRYLDCDLLVLDDIGVEMATAWNYQTLHTILDERDDNYLPIIFTSNLSPDELAEKWNDKRLVSRVLGMCKGHIVHMNGTDRRL